MSEGDSGSAQGLDGELTATSFAPGWMPIPALAGTDAAPPWIAQNAAALREAWGDRWEPVHDRLVPALLQAALGHRRPEDALAFQVWPTDAPVCIFVHAAVGTFPDGTRMPRPGDGILCDAEGLGLGVQLPIVEEVGDVQTLGVQFVFADAARAVSVVVEPTLPELIGILMPQIHGFVQSLRLTAPDGAAFRADPPALLEADPAETWIDSLTAT
nr:hypothetical protein [Microbacterium bovistercoris]